MAERGRDPYTDRSMIIPKNSPLLPADGQAAPLKPGAADRKVPAAPSPGQPEGSLRLSGELLRLRRERIARVLSALARQSGPSAGKALPALRAFFALLKGQPSLPAPQESLLSEAFLKAWLSRHGALLEAPLRKELEGLPSLWEEERRAALEGGSPPVVFSGSPEGPERPRWRMVLSPETPPSSPGEEEPSCCLELTLPRLGEVRALLRWGSGKSCSFLTASKELRRLIRKGLSPWRRRLARRGWGNLTIRVKRAAPKEAAQKSRPLPGVNLWG